MPWLRDRTVRVRLTVLYVVMFAISGALLLAIASGVTVRASSSREIVSAPPSTGPRLGTTAQIQQLKAQVAHLQTALAHAQSLAPNASGQTQLGHTLVLASLIALAIMTMVSAALGWLVSGRVLRPVSQMTAAARHISEDNLNERLAVAGPRDELRALGETFDGLLARLEGAFTAQRRFVANASHELRTPLTTMRAALDVALAKPEPPPPQTIALATRLRPELDRVDALLDAFLVLARAQHKSLPGVTVLPLDYAVAAALAGHAAGIGARHLAVQETSAPGGAWVTGSEALLTRLVENVVGNAVRHNTEGGWITVTTQAGGSVVSLVVENGGDELDPAQVAQLAQPFRRIGADRTGSDNGSGLGLSIVAAIAEAHGGTLRLDARDGGGLRVCVELPAAPGGPG